MVKQLLLLYGNHVLDGKSKIFLWADIVWSYVCPGF